MSVPVLRSQVAPVTVLKFGGASLSDGAGVGRVCSILLERGGERPVAVVSAAQGVTQLLDQVARSAVAGRSEVERVRIRHRTLLAQCGLEQELLDRYLGELAMVVEDVRRAQRLTPAQHDFVLSFGERMSARIVASSLRRMGRESTPVDAFDAGLLSDSNHGSARPLPGTQAAIRAALAQMPGIPVVTGFLAKDAGGNLTTLGRNGSDLTASLLAEALGAGEVQFWKTVGGVLTADPNLVPNARHLERLSYAEAAEYAFHGASILHPDALQPLARARIPARVLSVIEPSAEGTLIDASGASSGGPVGIACRRDVVRLRLKLGAHEQRASHAGALLAALARAELEPVAATASAGELTWVLSWSEALGRILGSLELPLQVERGLALLAVVGAPRSSLDEATGLSECQRAGRTLGLAEARLELVREEELPAAARALHASLFEASELLTQGF